MWIQVSSREKRTVVLLTLSVSPTFNFPLLVYPNAHASLAANRNSRKQTKKFTGAGKIFAQMFFAVVRTSSDGFMRTMKEKAIKTFGGSSLEEKDW
jgi:hypothetical protein